MKEIKVPVNEREYERLKKVKDDRTWREAMFDQFDVKEGM